MSHETPLSEVVTIVVAPREKFSVLPKCITSLFSTVPKDIRIILCMPQLPQDIYLQLQRLISSRGYTELFELEADIIPHNARIIGAAKAMTPWIVFTDNDIIFEKDWLEKLAEPMFSHAADVVAPLIFIGPPAGVTIHHAGGILKLSEMPNGYVNVSEIHRLMNKNYDDPDVRSALISNDYSFCDVAEFHCLAMRSELLQGQLRLTKDLITREQQDLALQCRKAGLKIKFVPDSKVTYMARSKFTQDDLRYHALRWSEQRANHSLDLMESKWGMYFNRRRVLSSWIEYHRRRPFWEREPAIIRLLFRKFKRFSGFYLRFRYGYEV